MAQQLGGPTQLGGPPPLGSVGLQQPPFGSMALHDLGRLQGLPQGLPQPGGQPPPGAVMMPGLSAMPVQMYPGSPPTLRTMPAGAQQVFACPVPGQPGQPQAAQRPPTQVIVVSGQLAAGAPGQLAGSIQQLGGAPYSVRPQQQQVGMHSAAGSAQVCFREDDNFSEEMRVILHKIDADGNGVISELELISAVSKHPDVASFLLPGVDTYELMNDEGCFDLIDEMYEKMSGGKQKVTYQEFVEYFKQKADEKPSNTDELRTMYDLIDGDLNGSVSKLELFDAVERNQDVCRLVMPRNTSFCGVLNSEDAFDSVKRVFESLAGGKKRFDFADFEARFRKVDCFTEKHSQFTAMDRSRKRVLIIGPGFGRGLNPRQGTMLEEAGFEAVLWCWQGLPNPETANFPVHQYLDIIRKDIAEFRPDVICAGSKGGAYMVGLWAAGYWRGPSLLINAHPSCTQIPEGVSCAICMGSNDEVYSAPRQQLEELVSTGSQNQTFLYYTANSGQLANGQRSRVGDRHNMESLLSYDCLPRLVDSTMSREGPEGHFMRTWRDRLSERRLNAERWLGYSPELLRKRWVSPSHGGLGERKLFDVPQDSEEFRQVERAFKEQPREPPAYMLSPPTTWDYVEIKKLERVENGAQHDGCVKPYYQAIAGSVKSQGAEFEPGVHTCWAFHGADGNAIDSIIHNPVAGFQPLASGTRGASLWGSGTYFARDAKYVADGGSCGQPAPDGTRKMLMCLLITGMACLGDPDQKGVLPFRRKPHRYHSSVDCLANPEVFIVQQSGAAQAAYLITFA